MQLRRVVVACLKLAKSGRQMRHKEHKRQWRWQGAVAVSKGESAESWGVSILTGINMAFYTISSQWKEDTHTLKDTLRESDTQGVIAGIVLQTRLHF